MNSHSKPFINSFKSTLICLFFILSSLSLTACDNTQKPKKSVLSLQQDAQKYAVDTTLSGKVSNKKGAIKSGEIQVTDSKQHIITRITLDNSSHYSVVIPAQTQLPIVLNWTPAPDSEQKEPLISVVIHAMVKKNDINELTTAIANKAKALGGYTYANIMIAADSSVNVPDANKTSTGFRGDPTTQYGGWH